MRGRSFLIITVVIFCLVLSACQQDTSLPQTPTMQPTATYRPILLITDTPTPTAESDEPEWSTTLGEFFFSLGTQGAATGNRLMHLPADCVLNQTPCPTVRTLAGTPPITGSRAMLAWSPDGSTAGVTLTAPSDQRSVLYLYDPDGETWRAVERFSAVQPRMAWSADSAWLAFAAKNEGWDIFMVRADGSDLTNLTNGFWKEGEKLVLAGWLEESIIISAGAAYDERVFAIDPFSGALQPLSGQVVFPGSSSDHLPLEISPDGNHLLYLDFSPDQGPLLMMMDRHGNPEITLANAISGWFGGFVWMPDTSWVAYWTQDSLEAVVYLIRPNGRERQIIFETKKVNALSFSQDSENLAIEYEDDEGAHLTILALREGLVYTISAPGIELNQAVTSFSWRP